MKIQSLLALFGIVLSMVLSTTTWAANSNTSKSTGTQCSINPNPIDSSKFVVDIDGRVIAQTGTFHDALGLVNRLATSKSCSTVNQASLERTLNQPCTGSLCGDGAESCMGPCQCNGMACVVY